MGKILHFRQLDVWQEAHKLVLMVYQMTKNFPKDERFGLVAQMRRAAVSIPANIAEGFKRRGILDKIRFYNIAEGSLEELKVSSQFFGVISLATTCHCEPEAKQSPNFVARDCFVATLLAMTAEAHPFTPGYVVPFGY